MRALRSIGSGQWTGKGFAAGEQNQLGWLPEQHTDMILPSLVKKSVSSAALLFYCYLDSSAVAVVCWPLVARQTLR